MTPPDPGYPEKDRYPAVGTVSRGSKGRVDGVEVKRHLRDSTGQPRFRTALEQNRIFQRRRFGHQSSSGAEGLRFPWFAESLCLAAGGDRPFGSGDRGLHRAYVTEKPRNLHRLGGSATKGERRHRKPENHRRKTQENWAGNPLETFVYCRLKQKLTLASPACCGTPLSELPMVRRPLRKKRRIFRQ